MASGNAARHSTDDVLAVKIARDMPHRAMAVKLVAVKAGDTCGFLSAMLQGVQPQRDHRGCTFGVVNTEDSAFLAQLVIIEGIGGEHVQIESRMPKLRCL